MAHYAYKEVMYDRIPSEFLEAYSVVWEETQGEVYDNDPNYNGSAWHCAACYIDYLTSPLPREPNLYTFIKDNF